MTEPTIPPGLFRPVKDMPYDEDQLAAGMEVEREHTDRDDVAEVIAKHHLAEDPRYYDKLKEAGL